MTDNPKWQAVRLDEIERRGRDIPVREHLGIHAFGVNAFTPGEDNLLIGEHNEAGSGQEELYIVLDGTATFEIDGETVDAPPGHSCSSRRSHGGRRPGSGPSSRSAGRPAALTRGSTGARRGRFTETRWPRTATSATPMRSKRSAPASSSCRTTRVSITTSAASRRSPVTPATRRSTTSTAPSSSSRHFGSSAQGRRFRRRTRRSAVRASPSLTAPHAAEPDPVGRVLRARSTEASPQRRQRCPWPGGGRHNAGTRPARTLDARQRPRRCHRRDQKTTRPSSASSDARYSSRHRSTSPCRSTSSASA